MKTSKLSKLSPIISLGQLPPLQNCTNKGGRLRFFFRDIKQLLHIKTFIGTSENAVKIQIWTALITILILKYLKSIAKYPWQLSNLVAFIRLNIFVKINLQYWLDKPFDQPPESQKTYYQGVLF